MTHDVLRGASMSTAEHDTYVRNSIREIERELYRVNDKLIVFLDHAEGLAPPDLREAVAALLGEEARSLRSLQESISNMAETIENKLGGLSERGEELGSNIDWKACAPGVALSKHYDVEKAQAAAQVAFAEMGGSRYRHYKGGHYSIVTVVVDEATGEPLVIYRSTKFDYLWARKLDNFIERVNPTKENPAGVPRFERVPG